MVTSYSIDGGSGSEEEGVDQEQFKSASQSLSCQDGKRRERC